MSRLFERLEANASSDMYPLHMPGHKRRPCGKLSAGLYGSDITEIDGFDNLHQPEGIFLELQKEAARLYGSEKSYYLVNGSTGGILSAISAALPLEGHILMARNCHKSAYHAVYLRKLTVSYLMPTMLPGYDICEGVTPDQVSSALDRESDIQAVLIVSPTYEGRLANVREIARIVHERGIPLIVDEAHGAHLGLAKGLHENSCQAGADLVIHSVHKTLPALTQSALLHVCGNLIRTDLLERFLHIYQSSSPSYLLTASIDNALAYVKKNGEKLFADFAERYFCMRKELDACKNLHFPSLDDARQDLGKLVISVKGTGLTGKELYDILVRRYHLQPEMAAESYVLAMFTVNDSQEGYDRLAHALRDIDAELIYTGGRADTEAGDVAFIAESDAGEQKISLAMAWDMETDDVPVGESAGRYAGEFINLYPPGIPLLVPGERITEDMVASICRFHKEGLTVQGINIRAGGIRIRILKVM